MKENKGEMEDDKKVCFLASICGTFHSTLLSYIYDTITLIINLKLELNV